MNSFIKNMTLKEIIFSFIPFALLFHILIPLQFQSGRGEEINTQDKKKISTEFQGVNSVLSFKPNTLARNGNYYNQNQNQEPFFCDRLMGQHYMVGSYNFCGGFNVNNCSSLCFAQNFTYFQCERNICHCFSQF